MKVKNTCNSIRKIYFKNTFHSLNRIKIKINQHNKFFKICNIRKNFLIFFINFNSLKSFTKDIILKTNHEGYFPKLFFQNFHKTSIKDLYCNKIFYITKDNYAINVNLMIDYSKFSNNFKKITENRFKNIENCLNILLNTSSQIKFSDNFSKKILKISFCGFFGKTSVILLLTYFFNKFYFKTGSITNHNTLVGHYLMETRNFFLIKKNNHIETNINLTLEEKYLFTFSSFNEFLPFLIVNNLSQLGCKIVLLEIAFEKTYSYCYYNIIGDLIVLCNFSNLQLFYKKAKYCLLFKQLFLKNLTNTETLFISNKDDVFSQILFIKKNKFQYFITFSNFDFKADVFSKKIIYSIWGTEIKLSTFSGFSLCESKLIGKHNLLNLICAITVGLSLNFPLSYIVMLISNLECIPGRTQNIDLGQSFNLIVDYADSPEAVYELLKSYYESCCTKIILICGDIKKNKYINKFLMNNTKKLFITANNPRWNTSLQIYNDFLAGLSDSTKYFYSGSVFDWLGDIKRIPLWFEFWFYKYQNKYNLFITNNRGLAMRLGIAMATNNDIVAILGRGGQRIIQVGTRNEGIKQYFFHDISESRISLEQIISIYNSKFKIEKIPLSF